MNKFRLDFFSTLGLLYMIFTSTESDQYKSESKEIKCHSNIGRVISVDQYIFIPSLTDSGKGSIICAYEVYINVSVSIRFRKC